jgi:hypothetical protein
VVDEAVCARARATRARGERLLRKLGVHVVGRRDGPAEGLRRAARPGDQEKAS